MVIKSDKRFQRLFFVPKTYNWNASPIIIIAPSAISGFQINYGRNVVRIAQLMAFLSTLIV